MKIHSSQDLAAYVTTHRQEQKLTQATLADRVGLKQSTVSAFENKPDSTRLDTLFRILSASGLELQVVEKDQTQSQDLVEDW